MGNGRALSVLMAVLSMAALGAGCSGTTRYRVLRFFFDGVPEPGAVPVKGYAADGLPRGSGADAGGQTAASPARQVFAHAPFRDYRCGACHDPDSGGLFRTAQEGLCRNCHGEVTESPRYLHGPAAVSDCLFCHHPHSSTYAGLLLAEADELCLRCHDREDVLAGPAHAAMGSQSCVACHDPHGGNDRFFLRQDTQ